MSCFRTAKKKLLSYTNTKPPSTKDNSPTFVHFLHTFTIRTLSLSQSNFMIYLFVTKMPPTIRGTNNKKESPPPKKNIEPAKKN
ncbi:hypothetical protein YC2023_042076 [Brassica napus]